MDLMPQAIAGSAPFAYSHGMTVISFPPVTLVAVLLLANWPAAIAQIAASRQAGAAIEFDAPEISQRSKREWKRSPKG
jgi:hypothetical protein